MDDQYRQLQFLQPLDDPGIRGCLGIGIECPVPVLYLQWLQILIKQLIRDLFWVIPGIFEQI